MLLEERRRPGCLQLRVDAQGTRYALDGQVLESGAPLEILLQGGEWLRGTFEWDGDEIRWPGLRLALGGFADDETGYRPSLVAPIPPQAILRWPAQDC
jgi:hypothetical protein